MMKRLDRGLFIAISIGVISLALTGLFVRFRITNPSDGARLTSFRSSTRPEGVAVSPLDADPSGLQEDDVVVALDNRSIEAWAEDLFRPRSWGFKWETGDPVTYTVLRNGQEKNLSLTLAPYPIAAVLATYWGPLLFAFTSQVVATAVLFLRPHERATRILFIWAWSGSHTYAWSLGQQVSDLASGFGFWLYNLFTPTLWLLYWSAALHFALIYPQKHPLVQRFTKFIPGIYVGAYTSFFAFSALTWSQSSGIIGWLRYWRAVPDLIPLIYLALAVFFVLWGYFRIYGPISRRKVRWVVYGVCISGGGGLILWIMPPILIGRAIISANVLGLLTLFFPITLAIAILRHQLFDIDLLINRTLVYALLTGSLALLYFGGVVLLQSFFRALTGETSQVAIVASTLAIAGLFSPLRQRVQSFIDRRFYRNKYDAQKALASFSKTLRQEVDLETLQSSLVAIVLKTVQPEFAFLWLREQEVKREA